MHQEHDSLHAFARNMNILQCTDKGTIGVFKLSYETQKLNDLVIVECRVLTWQDGRKGIPIRYNSLDVHLNVYIVLDGRLLGLNILPLVMNALSFIV